MIKNFLKSSVGTISFVAGSIAIGSGLISLVSYTTTQDFVTLEELKFPFAYVFQFMWAKIIVLIAIEIMSKYVFGLIMVFIVVPSREYRFAKIFTMALVALISAGLSLFNTQWLILGRPREELMYTVWFVVIATILFVISISMTFDHYKTYFRRHRGRVVATRSRLKIARRFRGSTEYPLWDMSLIAFYQLVAFVTMGMVTLFPL